MAIVHLETFVQTLNGDAAGKLLNQDGTPFEARNAFLLSHFLARSLEAKAR
jgi:hypothetical protein